MALSKRAKTAEGPRKTGSVVWLECNMRGQNRVVRVKPCAERTYVFRGAEKVVRVLTKNSTPPSAACSAIAVSAAKAGRLPYSPKATPDRTAGRRHGTKLN